MNPFNNENPLSIEALRKLGYSVRVTHNRPIIHSDTKYYAKHMESRAHERFIRANQMPMHVIRGSNVQSDIWARGGETVIDVSKGDKTFTARSVCSVKDAFNRREGIKVCLARIAEELNRGAL